MTAATVGNQGNNAQALTVSTHGNSGVESRQGQPASTRQGGQASVAVVQSGHGRQGQQPHMHSGHGRQGQLPMHLGAGTRQGQQQKSMALMPSGNGRQGMPPPIGPSGSARQGQPPPPMGLVHSGNGRHLQPPLGAVHSGYGGQGLRPMVYPSDGRQIALMHPGGEGRQMQHPPDLPASGAARFGLPQYNGMPQFGQSGIGRQLLPGYGAMPWSHPLDGRLDQTAGFCSVPFQQNGREVHPGQDTALVTHPGSWRPSNGRKRSRQDPRLEHLRGGKKVFHFSDQGYECEPSYEPSSQESCLSQVSTDVFLPPLREAHLVSATLH